MNPALWYLIQMQLVGWLRFAGQGMKTVRGALLMLVSLMLFVPWLLTIFLMPNVGGMPATGVERYGPAVLLAYIVFNLIMTPSSHPVYFSPPEIQFLFSGPFGRRELLVYKVMLSLLASLPMTLFMGLMVRIRSSWAPAVLGGLFLISTFMLLFSIALGLLTSAIGESLRTRTRWAAATVVVALLGAMVYSAGQATNWDTTQLANSALDSTAWKVASWPVGAYFQVMTAQSWAELAVPFLVGLAINGLLLLAIFGLDIAYEEQAAAGSAALYARILRARGQQVNIDPPMGKEVKRRFSLPSLPFLGGVGPVIWRQALTAYRSLGRLALIGLMMGGFMSISLMIGKGTVSDKLIGTAIGASIWLSIILPMIMPFDFRGDIDRMSMLKTLPVSPWLLALGQIVVPTLLMAVAGWSIVMTIAVVEPTFRPLAIPVILAVPVFTSYVIAVENVMFLFFPTRIAATPGDFQGAGRNVLLSFAKMFSLLVPVLAGTLGGVLGALTQSVWLGFAIGCSLTLMVTAGLVILAGYGFIWFDVGRTNPA